MFRLIKLFILAFFPSLVVSKLRYLRIFSEKIKCFLYSKGVKVASFYPYYLKYKGIKIEGEINKVSEDPMVRWGLAFCHYNSLKNKPTILLSWADGPQPGNFGDWLSPYVISKLCEVNIIHINEVEVKSLKRTHVVAIGSIIGSINRFSHVIGSGITSTSERFDINSKFHSVRGKKTAQRLCELGGDVVGNYGDLGYLLRDIYYPKKKEYQKQGVLVVRHLNHQSIALTLDEEFRELSIACSHPDDIEAFIEELHKAAYVATSAMHCLIACISYGIPCVFFTFNDGVHKVPGDGVKYQDVVDGVGLSPVNIEVVSDAHSFCSIIRKSAKYINKIENAELDKMKRILMKAIQECYSH